MARIGKGELGAAVVAAGMMLLGTSNPACAVPRSPSAEVSSETGGLRATEKPFGQIRVGEESSGHTDAGPAAAAGKSYGCKVKKPSVKSMLKYDTGSPSMLTGIKWTGGGIAKCAVPMAKISYKIFAGVLGEPGSHVIAAGSCKKCSKVKVLDKGYRCVQGATTNANCSGVWEVAYRVDITSPTGRKFTPTSRNCYPYRRGAVCRGDELRRAPLFATSGPRCKAAPAATTDSARLASAAADKDCYNLPPSGKVVLSLKAIKEIRDRHFAAGSHVDNAKGLFLKEITNRDLAKILDTGLKDTSRWALNSSNYYEKTFAYAGVGNRSIEWGHGLPSTKVTVVVGQFARHGIVDVVTMYPADA